MSNKIIEFILVLTNWDRSFSVTSSGPWDETEGEIMTVSFFKTGLWGLYPSFYDFFAHFIFFVFPSYDEYGDHDWNILVGLGHSLFL